jgi:hypothetical protein
VKKDELKELKLGMLIKKCQEFGLKHYGTKQEIFDRNTQHYVDNQLGDFLLDDLVTLIAGRPKKFTKKSNLSCGLKIIFFNLDFF